MRALDLRRTMNDTRGAAIESYTLGMLLDYQGRFGAAVNSKQTALNTFQELKDKTYWMAEIQGGYAQALILAGRGDESKSYLDDALNLAREVKNEGMVSQTISFQGNAAYYLSRRHKSGAGIVRGGIEGCQPEQRTRKNPAGEDQSGGSCDPGRAGAAGYRNIATTSAACREPGIKVHASGELGHHGGSHVKVKDRTHARLELERALLQADKLGLKSLSAQAHYLLASIFQASGDQVEAKQHYQETLQLIDAMKSDPGADKILQRSDFKTMYAEATRGSQSIKG